MAKATEIEFSSTGYRQLVKALATLNPQPQGQPEPQPDPYAAAACPPWTRAADTGSATYPEGAELVAFLEPSGDLRWIGADCVPDVPDGWRPLLVGPAVNRKARS